MRMTRRHDNTLKEDDTINKHNTLQLPKCTIRRGGLSLSITNTRLALSGCQALDAFKYELSSPWEWTLVVNNISIFGPLKQRPHQHPDWLKGRSTRIQIPEPGSRVHAFRPSLSDILHLQEMEVHDLRTQMRFEQSRFGNQSMLLLSHDSWANTNSLPSSLSPLSENDLTV